MGFSASPRRILALWLPRLPTDRLQRRSSAARDKCPPPDPPSRCALRRDRPPHVGGGGLESDAHDTAENPLVVVAKIDNALRLTAVDGKGPAPNLATGTPPAEGRGVIPSPIVAQDAE